MRPVHIWISQDTLISVLCLHCMGPGDWVLRPQTWLHLLVILWNSGVAGFITWFICRSHLCFSSDFRNLSLWPRQLNGLWIDLCRFLADPMVPHYTLRLSIYNTRTVCSSGGLWMRENRSRAPLRITSDSERLVHWRPQGAAQSRAEQSMRRCFLFIVGRLRGLQIQRSPFKLWQHFLEKQKNSS